MNVTERIIINKIVENQVKYDKHFNEKPEEAFIYAAEFVLDQIRCNQSKLRLFKLLKSKYQIELTDNQIDELITTLINDFK